MNIPSYCACARAHTNTHTYRNSLFFRLPKFRVKNIRVKIFSYKSNCTKIFLYEKFYNSRVVGIN